MPLNNLVQCSELSTPGQQVLTQAAPIQYFPHGAAGVSTPPEEHEDLRNHGQAEWAHKTNFLVEAFGLSVADWNDGETVSVYGYRPSGGRLTIDNTKTAAFETEVVGPFLFFEFRVTNATANTSINFCVTAFNEGDRLG